MADATFPLAPVIPFGDPVPGKGGIFDRVVSHCEDGKALLIDQFRRQPRIGKMLCALLEAVQEFDDATWQVLTERTLTQAVGVQLDGLGSIVGQPRGPLTADENYRAVIRGRILANRSDGTTEAIYAILVAVLMITTPLVKLRRYGTGSYTLTLLEPVTFDEGIINGLIQDATTAGVRAVVVVPMVAVASSFVFGPTSPTVTKNAAQGFEDTTGATGGQFARAMDGET